LNDADPLILQICENYLQKIRRHICNSVTFLAFVDFRTPFEQWPDHIKVDDHQIGWGWTLDRSTYYYIMISIWYVMSNCSKSLDLPGSPIHVALSTYISSLISICNPLSNVPNIGNDAKMKLLRWYHNASVMKITERLQDKGAYKMTDETKDLEKKIKTNEPTPHKSVDYRTCHEQIITEEKLE
jgi:hypothetical protein